MSISSNPPPSMPEQTNGAKPFSAAHASTDKPLEAQGTGSPAVKVAAESLRNADATASRTLSDVKASLPSGTISKMANKVTAFINRNFVENRPTEAFAKGNFKEGFSFMLHNMTFGKMGKLPGETPATATRSTAEDKGKGAVRMIQDPAKQEEMKAKLARQQEDAKLMTGSNAAGTERLSAAKGEPLPSLNIPSGHGEDVTSRLLNLHAQSLALQPWNAKVQLENAPQARAGVQATLTQLGRTNLDSTFPMEPNKLIQNWTLNFDSKNDEEVIQLGASQVTVGEIRELQASAKVRFLDGEGLDASTLTRMMTEGPKDDTERYVLAKWRCVSSEVLVTHTGNGEPLSGKLQKIGLYNMSAPDISKGISKRDYVDGIKFNKDLYAEHQTKELGLFFQSAAADGHDMVVVSGFGQSAFLRLFDPTPAHKAEARHAFAESLINLVAEKDYPFQEIVYAEGNPEIRGEMVLSLKEKIANLDERIKSAEGTPEQTNLLKMKANLEKIQFTNKIPMDYGRLAAENGFKPAIINAGDPSTYAGQYWETGDHTAQDEANALFSTFVLAQHLPANKALQAKPPEAVTLA